MTDPWTEASQAQSEEDRKLNESVEARREARIFVLTVISALAVLIVMVAIVVGRVKGWI